MRGRFRRSGPDPGTGRGRLLWISGAAFLVALGCAHTPADEAPNPAGSWQGEAEMALDPADARVRFPDGPPQGSRSVVLALDLRESGGRVSGQAYLTFLDSGNPEPLPLSVTGTAGRRSITLRLQPERLQPITLRGVFPGPDTLEAVLDGSGLQGVEVVLVRVRDPGGTEG